MLPPAIEQLWWNDTEGTLAGSARPDGEQRGRRDGEIQQELPARAAAEGGVRAEPVRAQRRGARVADPQPPQ